MAKWDQRNPLLDEAGIIADVFAGVAKFLKIYTTYCANQPLALLKLEELKKNQEFVNTLKVI